jgi:hypothetical protein
MIVRKLNNGEVTPSAKCTSVYIEVESGKGITTYEITDLGDGILDITAKHRLTITTASITSISLG